LKQLWRETGGGDMLESETILGPYGKVDLTDDIDSVMIFIGRGACRLIG
jgi:hypothetical protein